MALRMATSTSCVVRQMHQQNNVRGALHAGAHGTSAILADDEVPRPVTGRDADLDLMARFEFVTI